MKDKVGTTIQMTVRIQGGYTFAQKGGMDELRGDKIKKGYHMECPKNKIGNPPYSCAMKQLNI